MAQSTAKTVFELRAENLFYEINDQFILNDLSLKVQSGQALFIEGGNGSGKTTLLRILCGLIQADEGQVLWNQASIDEEELDYYQNLTYIGHTTGVKPELTAMENIRFASALSGLPAEVELQAAIDWVGLKGYENSPGRHLSFGQQRRIGLSRLLVDASPLWILDEPFAGLDKKMVASLEESFANHTEKGGLLILSSHQNLDLKNAGTLHLKLGE